MLLTRKSKSAYFQVKGVVSDDREAIVRLSLRRSKEEQKSVDPVPGLTNGSSCLCVLYV